METTRDQKKKKILFKSIVGLLVAFIVFPILFVIGYTTLPGKIISFIFYTLLCSYAIYEFTSIFTINKWIKFYFLGLSIVAMFFPLNELLNWFIVGFKNKELEIKHVLIAQYNFKMFYPGLGFTIFTVLISIPFFFMKIDRNKIFVYLITFIEFFIITTTAKILVYSTHEYLFYVILVIAASVTTDTFAYIGGMLFGNKLFKHKLAPKISPNKTIEGAIIGYIFGFIVLFFVLRYSNIGVNFIPWWIKDIIIPITLPIAAIAGDLIFSFVKRFANIKDFSNLIPGHGGVLDRVDSHIIVSFIYMALLII